MAYQPFLISGFKTAKSIGLEPWLSPPDAFPTLENMHVNKGVLEKRLGFSPFAQMKHGNTAQTTTSITGIKTYLKNGMPCLLIMDSKGSAGVYTGRCNFYNPVDETMTDISSDLGTPADIFTGSPSDFFHFCNWQGVGYMVNNVDQIYKWEGRGNAVVPFNIQISSDVKTNHIDTCRFIFIKDDRILLLDTVEFGDWCPQRCRYSPVLQTDFSASGAGYIDAPTQERICAAGYVGKNIAVYTQGGDTGTLWLIKSTGNADIPFKWERITTTELCRSPYSGVELKDGLAAIGVTNIIFYDGFKIKDLDIPHIRDYLDEFDDNYIRSVFGYSQKDVRHLLFTFKKVALTTAEIVILDSYDANSNDVIETTEIVLAANDYDAGTLPIKLYLILVDSWVAGILIWNFPFMDRILDYNIMENNWTIHRSTQTFFLNCIGGFTGQKVPSMSELDDVVASDGALVNAITVDSRAVLGTPKPYTLIGCRNSKVYKWNDGEFDGTNDNSGKIAIDAKSINLNPFVKKGLKVACEKIGFLVDNDSSASFKVDVFKNTSIDSYTDKIISCDGSDEKFWAWIFCGGEIGNFHRLEISHTEKGNTPKIHAFKPFFAPAGRLDL